MSKYSTVLLLTYDDLAGFYCLSDLIGSTHLRVSYSSNNKDDKTWASPAFVLSVRFVLLASAVKQKLTQMKFKRESKWKKKNPSGQTTKQLKLNVQFMSGLWREDSLQKQTKIFSVVYSIIFISVHNKIFQTYTIHLMLNKIILKK